MAPDFFWLGNHVGIDLVNTAAADDGGRPVELLGTWDALTAWLEHARLVPRALLGRVPAGNRAQLLEWVRAVRAATRAVLVSAHDATAARLLDQAVSLVPVRLTYSTDPTYPEPVTTRTATDRVRLAVALAALEASRLDRKQVRPCGREGCVLLFFDTSKNNARRWCDMAVCGNRVKAATHYRKRRVGK